MNDEFLGKEFEGYAAQVAQEHGKELSDLLTKESYVGDLIKIGYEECDVLVHDALRQSVAGLPLGAFLLATRLQPGSMPKPNDEDSSIILLRVTGQARLPNAAETENYRFLAGQRASDTDDNWDADGKTDQYTLHQLRYAGVLCRVLGSFRVREAKAGHWNMVFGADISNFYSGRGMKVYKPIGASLERIVNFTRPILGDSHPLAGRRIEIGRVRYAASEVAANGGVEGVAVTMDPTDLVARRTAMFGMSRTGKSNTTKVISKSVFKLRELDPQRGRVGQLILDVNGEYANENTQDGGNVNASCLKNVWRDTTNSANADVVTYGMAPHPNDPGRRIAKVNFFGSEASDWLDREKVMEAVAPVLVGKEAIDVRLAQDTSKYISSFRNTPLDPPQVLDRSSSTRYRRRLMVYRAALAAAGFPQPSNMKKAWIKGLFRADLVNAMANSQTPNAVDQQDFIAAAAILGQDSVNWGAFAEACKALRRFIEDGGNSGYNAFNTRYMNRANASGPWHDDSLTGLLEIFKTPNGVRSFRDLREQHDPNAVDDYAESVVNDLLEGRLVIFDQAMGDPDLVQYSAERIMWALFNRQKRAFIHPKQDSSGRFLPPSDVLVYVEEAHNLLPAGSSTNTKVIWSRIAKEGSKYRIGLVYATQEPSSIQTNILKNTDNWFVAHLNNSDETRELKKYYDFEDFVQSIQKVPEPGFLRMRTLSNPYIVPVQVIPFKV